jgi:hypothetical protein
MENNNTQYSFTEHKHRYALWTASRAVNRDFCSTKALEKMAIRIDMGEKVKNIQPHNFDSSFFSICKVVLGYFKKNKNSFKNPSFGRAAKFVSMYLKTFYIIDSKEDNKLRDIIYPPIDSILLKGITNKFQGQKAHAETIKILKKIKWTQMGKTEYKSIQSCILNLGLQFNWTLEEYWKPASN